jgi:hypothetical protein
MKQELRHILRPLITALFPFPGFQLWRLLLGIGRMAITAVCFMSHQLGLAYFFAHQWNAVNVTITVSVILRNLELLPPQLETGKSNTFNQ